MRIHTLALLTAALLFTLGACQGQKSNDVTLKDGLTVLDANEASVSMVYKGYGTVIYLEALRGQSSPDMYQKDPDAPKFEVDVRILAEDGRHLYSARGGDRWVSPRWLSEIETDDHKYKQRTSNEILFYMASEAAAVLYDEVKAQVGEELARKMEPMLTPIYNFGAQAVDVFLGSRIKLYDHLAELGLIEHDDYIVTPQREVLYGSGGTGCDVWTTMDSNYYYIAIHDKDTAVIARHSATRQYEWEGEWVWVHDNCNHGTCASGMGYKCHLNYHEAVVDYKPSWEVQSCGTDYSTFSDPGHNCHDDTRVQMANFVYGNGHNQGPGSNFWCSGDDDTDISAWPGDQSGSPTCDTNRDHGYKHDDMCRVQDITGWNSAGGCSCASTCVNYNNCCIDGPTPVPTCTPASNKLCPGEVLYAGQYRTSSDGRFRLIYQSDGNFVLYRLSDYYPMWSARSNSTANRAVMQTDGNLVTYNTSWYATWSAGVQGSGHYVVVQNDGNVVMYKTGGGAVWNTGTWSY